ncbi:MULTISPECIES: Gfo/Idh/MocA family oxidoreductase [unclassified Yoonia]|uniref:Gfo/Idh/MocA family protein n=1 Tax=unclassified Yoonia TaxID=2629118 RepID=UPI002AFE0E1D|nr:MULTISPECIES: Gfo/Idh/MocA family oxidoreductase [unclassified Yoonia]
MTPIRWGILGAADFARRHMAPAIHAAKGAELYALATSSPEKAEGFAEFAPGIKVHDSYDALLADPAIDAIYIPLPNHLHVEWSLKALAAGKPVLCEKPMGLDVADYDKLIKARDKSGLLAAEAFMIVHHPQFIRARDLVQGGAIGKLMHVDAVFSFNNGGDASNIRNRPETAGGALRDIGVYVMGAARFVTGQEPEAVPFANLRLENDVDVFAQIAAQFAGFTYSAVVSMRMQPRQQITFHGDKGVLTLTCPFNANVFDLAQLTLDTGGPITIERWPGVNHYILQVENFGKAIRGEADYPCPLESSRGTQIMMDMVFAKGAES